MEGSGSGEEQSDSDSAKESDDEEYNDQEVNSWTDDLQK